MTEQIAKVSMAIILHAGDARNACKEVFEAISIADFDLARTRLEEGRKKIAEAHKIQTDIIQDEAQGKESEYSLLFSHAQDTLMTVNSEINTARQLLKIFESYDMRLKKLESKAR